MRILRAVADALGRHIGPDFRFHPLPDTPAMLALLQHWAPLTETRRKILVDNPARLYRF